MGAMDVATEAGRSKVYLTSESFPIELRRESKRRWLDWRSRMIAGCFKYGNPVQMGPRMGVVDRYGKHLLPRFDHPMAWKSVMDRGHPYPGLFVIQPYDLTAIDRRAIVAFARTINRLAWFSDDLSFHYPGKTTLVAIGTQGILIDAGLFPQDHEEEFHDPGFLAWLRDQKDRDDPVGDLAGDFIRETRNGGAPWGPDFVAACEEAREAREEAYAEWSSRLER